MENGQTSGSVPQGHPLLHERRQGYRDLGSAGGARLERESSGYVFDTLGRLGHPTDIIRWAKKGVPTPEVIPLTRLGENNYNRWFPNTGF